MHIMERYLFQIFNFLTCEIFDIVVQKFSSLDGYIFSYPFSYLKFLFSRFIFNIFIWVHVFLKKTIFTLTHIQNYAWKQHRILKTNCKLLLRCELIANILIILKLSPILMHQKHETNKQFCRNVYISLVAQYLIYSEKYLNLHLFVFCLSSFPPSCTHIHKSM